MTFPGAGAQIYHNEAGEPLGWDYPGPDDFEDFDEADYADEGEDEDEDEWEDEGDEPDIHDPAHERGGVTEDRDPHPTHCCQRHGCKYGSGDMCSVARIDRPGRAQIYLCERCDDDMDDERAEAEPLNAMYDLAYRRGVADTRPVAS